MKPLVIQLLGQARSGKDWTASQFKAYFESQGKSVEIMSYAAPMKRIAAELFGISLDQLDDFKNRSDKVSIEVYDNENILDKTSPSFQLETNFRIFLQRLGNDAIKPIFGDNVWAKLAKENIAKSTADIIIIPDCRFAVELNEVGGTTVRIVNDSLPPPMNHPSELELLNYPAKYTLDNTDHCLTYEDITDLAKRILHDRTNS